MFCEVTEKKYDPRKDLLQVSNCLSSTTLLLRINSPQSTLFTRSERFRKISKKTLLVESFSI